MVAFSIIPICSLRQILDRLLEIQSILFPDGTKSTRERPDFEAPMTPKRLTLPKLDTNTFALLDPTQAGKPTTPENQKLFEDGDQNTSNGGSPSSINSQFTQLSYDLVDDPLTMEMALSRYIFVRCLLLMEGCFADLPS